MGEDSIPKGKGLPNRWYEILINHSNLDVIKSKSFLIQNGFNKVFHIEAADSKFIFRVSSTSKPIPLGREDYLCELEILEFIGKQGFSIARPIKWKSGKYVLEVVDDQKERFFCSMFDFASGKPVLPYTSHQQYELGQFLGKLHQCMNRLSTSYRRIRWDIANGVIRPISQFKKFRQTKNPIECLKLDKIQSWMIQTLQKYEGLLPKGFVHGDLHNLNIHFSSNNEFTLFDFDFMAESYLVFDLVCFIGTERLFLEMKSLRDREISYNAFIKGYESVRTLNPKELEILPVLEIMRWLILLGTWAELSETRAEEFKNGLSQRFESTMDRIDWLMDVYGNTEFYLNRKKKLNSL